jgi:hypothetical protein
MWEVVKDSWGSPIPQDYRQAFHLNNRGPKIIQQTKGWTSAVRQTKGWTGLCLKLHAWPSRDEGRTSLSTLLFTHPLPMRSTFSAICSVPGALAVALPLALSFTTIVEEAAHNCT